MKPSKETMEVRTKEYKALKNLRYEEKKMDADELQAKDDRLANELRHVPTSYRKGLADVPPKEKSAVVFHVMRKENRPDGPTGNLCISKYTLGDDVKEGEGVEGEVWFPANGIPSNKFENGRGTIFCRLADVTRFERMGFVHIGLVGPYNMDDLVDLGQDYKHLGSEKFLEMLQAGYALYCL